MHSGKLSESIIKRAVLKEIHAKNPQVASGAGIGNGAAVIMTGGAVVTATTTVTLGEGYWGLVGINRVANDIACYGGQIIGVLMNVTMPSKFHEKLLKEIMRQSEAVCKEMGLQIIGGHTELSDTVTKPLISYTGLGSRKYDVSGKVRQGQQIAVTKWIGMEGAFLMRQYKKKELSERFPRQMLDFAKDCGKWLSVQEEADLAAECGVSYMHNLSNGGVLNALWELSVYGKSGMTVDFRKIPVRQEIIEMCEFYNMNPYRLLSGGSLLMTFEPECGIVSMLEKHGIPVVIIGELTDSNDKILFNEDEVRYIDVTCRDELWKLVDGEVLGNEKENTDNA